MSAKCQKQTHALQQNRSYSITSSAVARSDAGMVRPSALAVLRLSNEELHERVRLINAVKRATGGNGNWRDSNGELKKSIKHLREKADLQAVVHEGKLENLTDPALHNLALRVDALLKERRREEKALAKMAAKQDRFRPSVPGNGHRPMLVAEMDDDADTHDIIGQ
jgi:hypothetical protein